MSPAPANQSTGRAAVQQGWKSKELTIPNHPDQTTLTTETAGSRPGRRRSKTRETARLASQRRKTQGRTQHQLPPPELPLLPISYILSLTPSPSLELIRQSKRARWTSSANHRAGAPGRASLPTAAEDETLTQPTQHKHIHTPRDDRQYLSIDLSITLSTSPHLSALSIDSIYRTLLAHLR